MQWEGRTVAEAACRTEIEKRVIGPEGWPERLWKECWNGSWVDFTEEEWIRLGHEEQVRYAREYQEWYAVSKGKEVEKTIMSGGMSMKMVLVPPGEILDGVAGGRER